MQQINLFEVALRYATKAHYGQTRKVNGLPMIQHPVNVSKTLKEAGFSEAVIIAGLLHDTIEDTSVTLEDIKRLFGEEIAKIVAGNTENKSRPWEERKQHTIDWIKIAPIEVKALIVADKLDNLTSIMEGYNVLGEELWKFFKKGKSHQKWYFSGVAANMNYKLNYNQIPNFFFQYDEKVREFFE